jgi:hypothetical protein
VGHGRGSSSIALLFFFARLYSNSLVLGLLIFILRVTPKDSLYLFSLLEIEILMEKYTPTASLSGYPNVATFISYFSLSKDR